MSLPTFFTFYSNPDTIYIFFQFHEDTDSMNGKNSTRMAAGFSLRNLAATPDLFPCMFAAPS